MQTARDHGEQLHGKLKNLCMRRSSDNKAFHHGSEGQRCWLDRRAFASRTSEIVGLRTNVEVKRIEIRQDGLSSVKTEIKVPFDEHVFAGLWRRNISEKIEILLGQRDNGLVFTTYHA